MCNYVYGVCVVWCSAVAVCMCCCSKQFHPSRHSANAYVVFTTEDAAVKALRLYVVSLTLINVLIDYSEMQTQRDG